MAAPNVCVCVCVVANINNNLKNAAASCVSCKHNKVFNTPTEWNRPHLCEESLPATRNFKYTNDLNILMNKIKRRKEIAICCIKGEQHISGKVKKNTPIQNVKNTVV